MEHQQRGAQKKGSGTMEIEEIRRFANLAFSALVLALSLQRGLVLRPVCVQFQPPFL
jgi:hypothetical protein